MRPCGAAVFKGLLLSSSPELCLFKIAFPESGRAGDRPDICLEDELGRYGFFGEEIETYGANLKNQTEPISSFSRGVCEPSFQIDENQALLNHSSALAGPQLTFRIVHQ